MSPPPLQVLYHRQERILELVDHDQRHRISAGYLRRHSLSAAANGPDDMATVDGPDEQALDIAAITPCGLYALQIHFSDGHTSGLYSYDYLRQLAVRQAGTS